jgi:hypothetical protein
MGFISNSEIRVINGQRWACALCLLDLMLLGTQGPPSEFTCNDDYLIPPLNNPSRCHEASIFQNSNSAQRNEVCCLFRIKLPDDSHKFLQRYAVISLTRGGHALLDLPPQADTIHQGPPLHSKNQCEPAFYYGEAASSESRYSIRTLVMCLSISSRWDLVRWLL